MKHVSQNNNKIKILLTRLTDTKDLKELTDEILSVVKTQNLQTIALDLSDVNTISSAGLGVLLTLRKIGPITLQHAQENVLSVLTVTRLNTLFAIE